MSTDEILNEREKTHGDYSKVSLVTIDLWNAVNKDREIEYGPLTVEQKLAVSMILHKIARIICGDPNFSDHWDDIAGYAMLGKGKEEPTEFEKKYCVPLDGNKGTIYYGCYNCGAGENSSAPCIRCGTNV